MPKGISRTVLGLLALVSFPFEAAAWRAWNRHEVLPVSQGVWEVVSEIGSGAQDYWCGIGDYALRELRTQATQRIYIWQGIGPSVNRQRRKSVQFSLSPPAGVSTEPRISLSVKAVGDNLNAATARGYCYDRIDERFYPFN